MTIACPRLEWPSGLLQEGPEEDPSILLRGEAAAGSARFIVMAVRVDPLSFGPDYRPDDHGRIYADFNLSSLLDALSELVEISEASTLELASGRYVLWMLPRRAED